MMNVEFDEQGGIKVMQLDAGYVDLEVFEDELTGDYVVEIYLDGLLVGYVLHDDSGVYLEEA